VFTVSGSAGRYAMGDPDIMTDLTIGGIIDAWAPETVAKPSTDIAHSASGAPRDKAA
jgi:hypothetical protein